MISNFRCGSLPLGESTPISWIIFKDFPCPQYYLFWPAAAAKSLQSCPTLCDPIDSSPQGSSVPGILQARTLEWVAIFFSNAWKWKVKVKSLSRVRLLVTPWTGAHQAPPSTGFSRQEYWSGVPLPSPIYFDLVWSNSHNRILCQDEQGPTVEHRELYSVSCDKPQWKRILKGRYVCI